jgi:hypothetical protein
VAKVSELKERARAMEQQGELAKARAIYEHILKHLEGTAALLPELPMYVKVGDLALKLGDPAGAVAMYERAAENYAAAGSARSIGALAEKIRRADPTRDDAAVGLGRALLAHGHAGAAAEVAIRYARRIERADVASLLAQIAPEADDPISQGLVENALSVLAGPRPSDPEPAPAPAVLAVEPVAVDQPRQAPGMPSHVDEPGPREPEAEEDAASPRLDLPLYSFEPEPSGEAGPSVSQSDDGLVIRHGVEEPTVGTVPEPAPPPPQPPEPDFTAPLPREPERVEARPAPVAAAPSEETVAAAEEAPLPDEPDFSLRDETGPAAAVVAEAEKPRTSPEPPSRPTRERGRQEEPHVLVRESRAKPGKRGGLLAAGIALAVIGVGAAAWVLGLLPFGRGDGGAVEPASAGQAPVAESLPEPADSAGAVATADTTQFGPIGFNTVTNAPAEVGDTSGGDTVATGQGGGDTLPTLPAITDTPARPAGGLPRIVVPPGHAIVNEILVIPGLEVVSVAETRAGGAPGIRVIQRADDGEIALVSTLADAGADTTGRGQVAVRVEGDTSVGDVRVGRYLVQARSLLPPDVLSGLLGRLIAARPVN